MAEKIINVTVEKASDGYYWCSTEDDVYGGGLTSNGKTVEEAKKDLGQCLEEAKAVYAEMGGEPYEVKFVYSYDVQSFFNFFTFLNISEVARLSGINESMMRQMAAGKKMAGEKTYRRLSAFLQKVSQDFSAATVR